MRGTTNSPALATMTDAELNFIMAKVEHDKLQIERARLELEKKQLDTESQKLALELTFAKKWAVPLLGLAGVIIAALLSATAVLINSDYQNSENQMQITQRSAIAAQEYLNARDRLKVDFGIFLVNNWQSFSKASDGDRQAIVTIVTTLLPPDVAKDVVPKLVAAMPAKPDPNLQKALDLLNIPYNLTGSWRCTVKCQSNNPAKIVQASNSNLTITSEVGNSSSGVYKSPAEILAIDWGGLGASIEADGKKINWKNGTVWTKID